MALTDIQARNAKPKDKDYKVADGDGLYLLVTIKGGKYWRFKYRFDGKEKLLALGTYPERTLADARQDRDAARKLVAAGVDPSSHKKAQKAARVEANTNTFKTVALEWHNQKKANWSENHAGRLIRRLELDVFPFIGDKPISEIKTPELVTVLERIAPPGEVYNNQYRKGIPGTGSIQSQMNKSISETETMRANQPSLQPKHRNLAKCV